MSIGSFPWRQALFRGRLTIIPALIAAVVAVAGYFLATFSGAALPSGAHELGPGHRLARGRYLVNHVARCVACHGERDWSMYSGPANLARAGQRGTAIRLGVGTLYSPNITPAAVGSWTDGELIRAITEGVSRDGHSLSPVMPYDDYRFMARQDVESIVAYLRTLPPIKEPPVLRTVAPVRNAVPMASPTP